MIDNLANTEVFTTLNEVESKFNLRRNSDIHFFPEWYEHLPELTASEKKLLDSLKEMHVYHKLNGSLLQETINVLMAIALVDLAGFRQPLFKIRSQKSVQIEIDDGKEIVTGRLQSLVVQNQFWLLVADAEGTMFPYFDAIPQALA